MLKQNLNDKCFSMANIFSFAEKVIPDFKNKSEGEKFLFLYCITAKLLSNRLYDNESAADKINCLLSRIPKNKKENAEQLTESLETFIGEKDFSVEKVKSFFDTNKDLLNKIYENEKPADLLFFFAQIQSKNIFKEEKNEAFVNGMKYKNIKVSFTGCYAQQQYGKHVMYYGQYDICVLNHQTVSNSKVNKALEKDPNRIFNNYVNDFNKHMKLKIFGDNSDKYVRKGFKLTCNTDKKEFNEINPKFETSDLFVSPTLDIDKILKEKFGFKKINEMSKDELEKLNLNYDEEFIYFLVSEDFSNENFLQNKGSFLGPFYIFTMPKDIKLETTLKIFYYFAQLEHDKLTCSGINYLRDKFETSKDLLDAYNKLNGSLSFKEDALLNIFIGNPPKVEQVLKCQDTKSSEEINKLLGQCEFQDIIDYFVDVDDNKNQNLLSKYMLENPEGLCNCLKYIYNKLNHLKMNKNTDNNENKLKKLQDLMTSFFLLENANGLLDQCNFEYVINYFLNHDEGKELLLKCIYNKVENLKYYFGNMLKIWKELKNNENKTEQDNTKLKKLEYLITKFLLSKQDKVLADDQKYIGYIINMFELQTSFCMYGLNGERETDVTNELKKLLNKLIDKNLGLVENKDNIIVTSEQDDEEKKDEPIIVELYGKSYDLTKIYLRHYINKNENEDSYIIGDPVADLREKIEFHKKILSSQAVSQKTKQTVYFLAKKYKEYLQKTYDDFEKRTKSEFDKICNETLKLFLGDLKINQETYDRLKNADKNDVQEMKNRKIYLEKKANVTNFDYFNENWTTWLSFLLIIPIFLYIFIWKPEYENEINRLSNDLVHKGAIEMFEDIKKKTQSKFDSGRKINSSHDIYVPIDNLNSEDDALALNNNLEIHIDINIDIVAYKSSESGRYHKSMIDEMDKFINQYQKDFEPKEPKPNEEVPLTENENNIITDPDKNSP